MNPRRRYRAIASARSPREGEYCRRQTRYFMVFVLLRRCAGIARESDGHRGGVRLKHRKQCSRPEAKAGQQQHSLKIFLVVHTSWSPPRRGCLPTCRQQLDQSLADDQIVRWLRSTGGQPSNHRRERFSREGLRQICKPGCLLPGVHPKSGQRRYDVERHSILFIPDGREQKVVEIRMEQRKFSGQRHGLPCQRRRTLTLLG